MHSEGLLLIAQRIGADPFASRDRSFVGGATTRKGLGRRLESASVPATQVRVLLSPHQGSHGVCLYHTTCVSGRIQEVLTGYLFLLQGLNHLTDTLNNADSGNNRPNRLGLAPTMAQEVRFKR